MRWHCNRKISDLYSDYGFYLYLIIYLDSDYGDYGSADPFLQIQYLKEEGLLRFVLVSFPIIKWEMNVAQSAMILLT